MLDAFEYFHTVTADEIDQQGHANNVVYVAWMQAAALAHSAARGWTPQRYLELGMGWVARRHTIEYLRPAFDGDEIVVRTWVIDMTRVASTRLYRISRRSDSELLAKAETSWAFINYATGRPTRIPKEISGAFLASARTSR